MNKNNTSILKEARLTVIGIGVFCLIVLFCLSNSTDIISIIYSGFNFMIIIVAPLIFALYGYGGEPYKKAAKLSIYISFIYCLLSSLYLMYIINLSFSNNRYEDVLYWYKWMYFNPFIILIVSGITFIIVSFFSIKNQ